MVPEPLVGSAGWQECLKPMTCIWLAWMSLCQAPALRCCQALARYCPPALVRRQDGGRLPSHLTEGKAEAKRLQLKMPRGHQQTSCCRRSLGPICDLAPRARCPGFAVLAVSQWVSGKLLFCGH